MSLNKNLQSAKRQKNDEFYTQLADIENELRHYGEYFRDLVKGYIDDGEGSARLATIRSAIRT